MKRFLLVLFISFLVNIHVFAQWEGYDDDDEYDDFAGQPAAGAGGKTSVNIINSGAEEQSEQKLTLPNNQPIYLYFYNSVQNPAAPEPAAQPQSESKAEPRPYREPEPIIEYRYFPAPAPEPPSPPPPLPSPPPLPPPPPQIEYRYLPPPKVEYIYIQPPEPPPPPAIEYRYIPLPPPVQIRVIPSMPDPNSPRVYRLQVGSYAMHNTADMMAQRLRSAGLQAGIEYYNSLKRVFVPGVRAADACTIVQMLECLGFEEVWIRD